jgi:hypothetical protein
MRKFLKTGLLFVPFAIVIYIILVIVIGELNIGTLQKNLKYFVVSYGHTNTRIKEVKKSAHVDVLFLGSSHTYRGFDTRIFENAGYSTFNLGSSIQSPIQTELLLKRYLEKLQPKIVIYEVCPIALSTDGVESTCDIISNDVVDFDALKIAIKQNNIKIYNTLIYSYYRQFMQLDSDFNEPIKKDDDTYIKGGFVEKKIKFYKQEKIIGSKKAELNNLQKESFEAILDMAKAKNIKLILIQAPITKGTYNAYTNNDYFDKEMEQYGAYFNFNKMIQLNDSLDFFDGHHLNQNGVVKFNKAIIENVLPKIMAK